MYVALSASRAMEQDSQHSMSMKNKHFLNNMHFQGPMINRFNSSLEEHAFTYDSRFVWPPRSYSCSFCKRVFRSAQALGGHMNIHRRDRARLKQSLSPQNEVIHPETYNPSQVSYKSSNLNPTGNPNFLAISPHSPPTVLPDWKTAVRKGARREDFWFLGHDGCVESNLSMGLNLFISPSQPYGFDVDHEVITSHKRHKTCAVSSGNIRRCFFQSEVLGLKTGSLEELDLELRLGDPPKAK